MKYLFSNTHGSHRLSLEGVDGDFDAGGGAGSSVGSGVTEDNLSEIFGEDIDRELPKLTEADLAAMAGEDEEGESQAKPSSNGKPAGKFSFKYGDQEFGSPDDLTKYIESLAKPNQPQDIESLITQALSRERENYNKTLKDTIASMVSDQRPKAEPKAAAPAKNPYNPETESEEFMDFEVNKRVEAKLKEVATPLEQQLAEMKEQFGGFMSKAQQKEMYSDFDRFSSEAVKSIGVEKDTPEKIDELVMDIIAANGDVNGAGDPASLRKAINSAGSDVWKRLNAWRDRSVSEAINKAAKAGRKFPPSVIKGGGTPLMKRPAQQEKFSNSLTNDGGTLKWLAKQRQMRGAAEE